MNLKTMPLLLTAVTMIGCKPEAKEKEQSNEKVVEVVANDTIVAGEDSVASEPVSESLNDIRFEKFKTNKDWVDNEYVRTLRLHLDECANGTVTYACFEDYPEFAKSRFVVWETNPFLMGGLLIEFCFLEDPNILFSAHVYSDVDAETRTMSHYHVVSIIKQEEETGLTKQEMMEIPMPHPEIKFW